MGDPLHTVQGAERWGRREPAVSYDDARGNATATAVYSLSLEGRSCKHHELSP